MISRRRAGQLTSLAILTAAGASLYVAHWQWQRAAFHEGRASLLRAAGVESCVTRDALLTAAASLELQTGRLHSNRRLASTTADAATAIYVIPEPPDPNDPGWVEGYFFDAEGCLVP
ncbi:MAG: hypothetical protein AAF713_06765 [Pseudomonadota bacterium]